MNPCSSEASQACQASQAKGRSIAIVWLTLFLVVMCAAPRAAAQVLNLNNQIQTVATLANGTTATLSGKAELHITGTGDPIPGCVINLTTADSWLFLRNILPSAANATFLSRVRINGAAAVLNTNVRVVEHVQGAVIIPQGSSFSPMQVYEGKHFTGVSRALQCYTAYNDATLGPLRTAISSFRLKRGYTATIAQNEAGNGISRNYVAADGDLEIPVLPGNLDNQVRFIRIFPWRWTSKKGIAGNIAAGLNVQWDYNWNIDRNSTLDIEYVPIRQQRWWPDLAGQNWQTRGANHLLGYNEPNQADQANLTVGDAIYSWPDLLGTGLRVGAPAVTDGGYSWITSFMSQADAAGLRVDFVPVHYYRSYASASDPAGATTQFYNYLKSIHDATKRPLWVTEFNNGANWTTGPDPTHAQQQATVAAMLQMLETTPFVERYSIYNWVEDVRREKWDDGSLTDAGVTYRDKVSTLGYQQIIPDAGVSPATMLSFNNGSLRDTLANGNDAMAVGTPAFVAGKHGQAIALNGSTDWLQLPVNTGDSTDFTFTGWVKWNGGADWQRIFDLGTDTTHYLFLSPKGPTGLRFAINTGGGEQTLTGAVLPTGTWTHVAVTLAGNTGKLFINGAPVATNTNLTNNPVDVGTRLNYIGKSVFPADPLFNGQLDDLRFLTTALTDAQVLAIYQNAPAGFTGALAAQNATTFRPSSGTVAGSASGGGGSLRYSKVSGPGWLGVGPDGGLSGVPGIAERGANDFILRVTDSTGATDTAALRINVTDAPGPVARYAFEGNLNATAGTTSANATGMGTVAYGSGVTGQSFFLNGTNTAATLPAGTASADELTLAMWYYANTTTTWQRLVDIGSGTDAYLFISPRSGTGTLRFAIKNGGAEQTLNVAPPATGSWHHVAVTLGGGTGKLYLDGVAVDTQAITIKPSDFPHVSNFIGDSQFAADPLFNGRIDELAIYHQVLDAGQIAALANVANHAPGFTVNPISAPGAMTGQTYEQSIASKVTDADGTGGLVFSKVDGPAWLAVAADGRISGIPGAGDSGANRFTMRVTDPNLLAADAAMDIVVSPGTDLVAHYAFNGNTADSAGGAAATLAGTGTWTAGAFDSAIALDGTTNSLQIPAGAASGLNDFTVAARVKWNGGAGWQRLFDFGNGTNQYCFITPASAGGIFRFAITNAGNGAEQRLDAAGAFPTGEWVHVAVTVSGTTGTLYQNGVAVATGSITLKPAAFAPAVNYIGKAQFAADPLFNGAIDDFRIYNRGLGATEVAALANPPAASVVPDSSYGAWAAAMSFASPEDAAADADPDGDGFPNLWEYLLGGNPLLGDPGLLQGARRAPAGELGLPGSDEYLAISARVRKQRLGTSITALGGPDVESLSLPEAAGRAIPAGPPVVDGEDEIHTWYYDVPMGAGAGRGFLRLKAVNGATSF